MLRITDILDKTQSYLSADELALIEKAYVFSAAVHQGQLRLSGEPYLMHPMEVAGILADMKLDTATIITGLLHDTVEDTLTTLEQIEAAFGKDVAQLVDGLTKISKITYADQEERQAENYRKMILAMSLRHPGPPRPPGRQNPQHEDPPVPASGKATFHRQRDDGTPCAPWRTASGSTG